MAETSTDMTPSSAGASSAGTAMTRGRAGSNGLQTERGQTSIADPVVTKVAGIAAREVGEKEAAVDLTVVVEYGESIPRVAEQIRENVIRRIEGITGLSVTEVNVAVNDLHLPSDDQDDEPSRVQ